MNKNKVLYAKYHSTAFLVGEACVKSGEGQAHPGLELHPWTHEYDSATFMLATTAP